MTTVEQGCTRQALGPQNVTDARQRGRERVWEGNF